MRKYLLSAALAGAFCSGPALAANITYDSYTFSGVNIHIQNPTDLTGGAGPITLYENGVAVVTNAWCMDLQSYLAGSGTVGVLPFTLANDDSGLPGVPAFLSALQLKTIGWLVDLGDQATDPTIQAAFQVAIWSEEYGGFFSYESLGSTFANYVTNDLLAAQFSNGNAPLNLNFLVPGDGIESQTLVFGTPGTTAAAPEPSTWAMGLTGFAVLAGLGWKRSRKARLATI